jgi:hypothetical protein
MVLGIIPDFTTYLEKIPAPEVSGWVLQEFEVGGFNVGCRMRIFGG